MATGTGKTKTALRICEYLIRHSHVTTIIISTEGNDLLKQWYRELLQFVRLLPTRYAIIRHFEDNHDIERFLLNSHQRILLVSRLALPNALRGLSKEIATKTILIHDEVHGLGSPSNRKYLAGLSKHIRFRLGLSATPEREYDAEGNNFIEEHIGPVIFRFELADAIKRGILAPFLYYPLNYTIDSEDRERIKSIYAKASAREKEGSPIPKEELWTSLAFVYKTSKAKLPIFEDFIGRQPNLLTRCIIFVETKEYGDAVLDIVHKHNYFFHTYYAEDDSEILSSFANGDIQLLITCHRISEGIDIRSLETVILFSSSRARLETIQRIGRCLRTDPNAPDKISNIVDFVRNTTDTEVDSTADQEREQWLTDLAKNAPGGN
ncbi:DNA-repair protein [Dehalococcoides mccartyi]|uniref:DNA-repair protein n=1 Tax=Dehalococcoides mccartyi TaxID=61435 RepID=A0A328EPJ7_9CHLR|nr:DNA-repair protein [Dehalococcoides mccartyi]RAL70562.1 DNA-repair protein [Dehalococcoides mccartyi]